MKKFVLLIGLVAAAAFAYADTSYLLVLQKDIVVEQKGSDWREEGIDLYIRKKDGMESVMLVETTKDPEGKADSFAYRAEEYNEVNGDEIRYLDGKVLNSQYSKYSLISSTVVHHDKLGKCFHIYIPPKLVYGYPWERNGTVTIDKGLFINIRTFSKKYGDYTGKYQDNPFMFDYRAIEASVKKPQKEKKEEPKKEEPSAPKYIVPEENVIEPEVEENTEEVETITPEPEVEFFVPEQEEESIEEPTPFYDVEEETYIEPEPVEPEEEIFDYEPQEEEQIEPEFTEEPEEEIFDYEEEETEEPEPEFTEEVEEPENPEPTEDVKDDEFSYIEDEPEPAPPPLTLTDDYNPEAAQSFNEIADKGHGLLTYSKGPDTLPSDLNTIIQSIERKDNVDIVLAIDTTGSMRDDLESLKNEWIPGLLEQFQEFGYVRIGLLLYRDFSDDYVFEGLPVKIFNFTDSQEELKKNLDKVKIRGNEGGDIPEAVYEALYAGLRYYDWREDAEKKIILIGDAGPHRKPRGEKKISQEDVIKLANEKQVSLDCVIVPDDKKKSRGR